jgi:hypothetical protein
VVQAVCVWNPKEPPYRFVVRAPDGTEIELDPPGSNDEHAWHCQPPSSMDPLGIWVVKVEALAAASLPDSFGSILAQLNPDELSFGTDSFERQPLLRITGERRRRPRDCPRLEGVEIVSGCAPGEVTFRANGSNLGNAEEVSWNFGDGETAISGTPISGGIEITHEYETDGGADGFTVIVTVVLPEECVEPGAPSTLTASIDVPVCPPTCPDNLTIAITSDQGCAPGNITFRATTTNDAAVETWTWNFDDGTEIDGGREITHDFAESGPFDVQVSILKPEGCSPRMGNAHLEVLACEPSSLPPRCPTLSGIQVRGCTPGEVTLTALGGALDQPLEYQWGFGDGTGLNGGRSVTHTYTDDQPHTVAVTVRLPAGCPGRNPRVEAQVEPCRRPRPPKPFDWCLFFLIAMIVAFVLAGIMTVVAACLWAEVLTPAFWEAVAIAAGFLVIGLVIYILWMIFCVGQNRRCDLLRILVYALRTMLALAFIIGLLLLALQQLGCAAGAGIDFVWIGLLLIITEALAEWLGCATWSAGGNRR